MSQTKKSVQKTQEPIIQSFKQDSDGQFCTESYFVEETKQESKQACDKKRKPDSSKTKKYNVQTKLAKIVHDSVRDAKIFCSKIYSFYGPQTDIRRVERICSELNDSLHVHQSSSNQAIFFEDLMDVKIQPLNQLQEDEVKVQVILKDFTFQSQGGQGEKTFKRGLYLNGELQPSRLDEQNDNSPYYPFSITALIGDKVNGMIGNCNNFNISSAVYIKTTQEQQIICVDGNKDKILDNDGFVQCSVNCTLSPMLEIVLKRQQGSNDTFPDISFQVPVMRYNKTFWNQLPDSLKNTFYHYFGILDDVKNSIKSSSKIGQIAEQTLKNFAIMYPVHIQQILNVVTKQQTNKNTQKQVQNVDLNNGGGFGDLFNGIINGVKSVANVVVDVGKTAVGVAQTVGNAVLAFGGGFKSSLQPLDGVTNDSGQMLTQGGGFSQLDPEVKKTVDNIIFNIEHLTIHDFLIAVKDYIRYGHLNHDDRDNVLIDRYIQTE